MSSEGGFRFEGRHEGLPDREQQLRFRGELLARLRESLESTSLITPGSLLEKLIAIHIEASHEWDPYERKQLGRYIQDMLAAIGAQTWSLLTDIEREQYLNFLEQQFEGDNKEHLRLFDEEVDREEFFRDLPQGIQEDSTLVLRTFIPPAPQPPQNN